MRDGAGGVRRAGVALLLALCVNGSALAGVERVPSNGTPALEVAAPDDWAATRDQAGALHLAAPGGEVELVFSVVDAASIGAAPLDDMADRALRGIGAEPGWKVAPGEIGGRPGRAYEAWLERADGEFAFRLTLAPLDRDHLASRAEIVGPDPTPDKAGRIRAVRAKVIQGAAK